MTARQAPEGRDAGISLPEILVAMFILTVVTAVFMGGVVQMSRNTVQSSITVDAADSVRRVFQRFDKEIRYADAVNFPGVSATGRHYLEFRVPAVAARSGVTTCAQWRWDPATKGLESRSWPETAATLPAFGIVAEDIVAGTDPAVIDPADPPYPYPFGLEVASPVHPRQSVTVRLQMRAEVGTRDVQSQSLFVARNSTVDSAGNTDTNGDGVSDQPACWRAGVRP